MKNANTEDIVKLTKIGTTEIGNIVEIIQKLQKIVGFREVAIAPDVPPGASLESLTQAYKKAGLGLKQQYSSAVDIALEAIHRDLERQVYG